MHQESSQSLDWETDKFQNQGKGRWQNLSAFLDIPPSPPTTGTSGLYQQAIGFLSQTRVQMQDSLPFRENNVGEGSILKVPMRSRERIRNKCTTEKLRIHVGIVITSLGVGYKKELDHSLEPEAKSKQEKEKHKTCTGTRTLPCPLPRDHWVWSWGGIGAYRVFNLCS